MKLDKDQSLALLTELIKFRISSLTEMFIQQQNKLNKQNSKTLICKKPLNMLNYLHLYLYHPLPFHHKPQKLVKNGLKQMLYNGQMIRNLLPTKSS